MRSYIRALLLSFVDAFRENLGYHSASLTYQFLTVVGSVIMLLGFVSMYLPFLEPSRVYEYVKDYLPSHAELIFDKLLPVYEKRASGSLLSVALAYYFALSFAKTLNFSFSMVYKKKPLESELAFWVFMPLVLILYATALSFGLALLAIAKSFLEGIYQRLTELANFLLLLLLVSMLYSLYFRPRGYTFLASAFASLLLFILNKVFSIVVIKLISASPLYSVIGSPLLFLVWLYYSFFCLLLGACFLRRLDEPLQ